MGECLSDQKPVLYLPVSSGSSSSSSSTARTAIQSFVQGVGDYRSPGVPDISRGKIINIGTLSAIQQTLDCRNSLTSLVGSKTTGAAGTMCVDQSRVIFFGQHLEQQEGDYIRHHDNPRGLPTSEVPSEQAKQNHNIWRGQSYSISELCHTRSFEKVAQFIDEKLYVTVNNIFVE